MGHEYVCTYVSVVRYLFTGFGCLFFAMYMLIHWINFSCIMSLDPSPPTWPLHRHNSVWPASVQVTHHKHRHRSLSLSRSASPVSTVPRLYHPPRSRHSAGAGPISSLGRWHVYPPSRHPPRPRPHCRACEHCVGGRGPRQDHPSKSYAAARGHDAVMRVPRG